MMEIDQLAFAVESNDQLMWKISKISVISKIHRAPSVDKGAISEFAICDGCLKSCNSELPRS